MSDSFRPTLARASDAQDFHESIQLAQEATLLSRHVVWELTALLAQVSQDSRVCWALSRRLFAAALTRSRVDRAVACACETVWFQPAMALFAALLRALTWLLYQVLAVRFSCPLSWLIALPISFSSL